MYGYSTSVPVNYIYALNRKLQIKRKLQIQRGKIQKWIPHIKFIE